MKKIAALLLVTSLFAGYVRAADRPPNSVIIFVDDTGYGDLRDVAPAPTSPAGRD